MTAKSASISQRDLCVNGILGKKRNLAMIFGNFRLAVSLITLIFLSGCAANLPAVRDFAETTLVASREFESIAADIAHSCLRRVEIDYQGYRIEISENGDVKYSEDYESGLEVCRDAGQSLEGILDANLALQGYVYALGRLASDEPATFAADIDGLKSNLAAIKIAGGSPFAGQRAESVSKLAGLLVKIAAEGYRQKRLKQTIRAANPYFGDLIGGLIDIVEDYRDFLEDERIQLNLAQTGLARMLPKGARESAEINDELFQNKAQLESAEAKLAAASGYQTLLGSIAETHDKIAAGANALDSAELAQYVQGYIRELLPIVKNLKRAFK
ncbi:MAG: hypothetical protein ACT4NX_10220 [Deltaproteobacteria bacterium]